MATDPIRSKGSSLQAQAEQDMLQLILQESVSYVWDPMAPESSSYFAALEQDLLDAGWSTADLTEQGQILAGHLEQLWASVAPAAVERLALNSDLFQRFAAQIPHGIFDAIVQRTRQLVTENLSLADQLVQSVQDSLPTWGEDDLQVLARPFAYAMRDSDSEILESVLKSVRSSDWEQMSSIEQARLSLALARYTIDHTPTQDA